MNTAAERLKDKWTACNERVAVDEYISDIRCVRQGQTEFLLFLCRENEAGDNTIPLDSVGSLKVFSGRALRAPYHVTLWSTDQPQLRLCREFSDWGCYLAPRNLADAVEFASATDFVVGFSTVKSGASIPLNVHFQSFPRTIDWNGTRYELFRSLLTAAPRQTYGRNLAAEVSVLDYPVLVARIAGFKPGVCERTLRLCQGYDHLASFNLVIANLPAEECRGQAPVAVYFFPRPLDGHVVPTRYRPICWAFGSFEMAGVFLTRNEQAFRQADGPALIEALQEVSIHSGTLEMSIMENLLLFP